MRTGVSSQQELQQQEPRQLEPRHSYASIDGMRLHWAELGDAADTVPVVLLHGMLDAHLTWKVVGAALATDRRVLMPDLPGCGLSERPDASYELGWHAQMIARWIETLGLESVDVVGHSFGGGVAQMLLLERQARIRRMVLVASGGLGRGVGFWLRLATLPRVVELFGQPFMAFGTRRALGGASGMSEQDIAELSAWNAQGGSARAFARTVRDVIDWRGQSRIFYQRVHEVARLPPVAVFWGDRDAIIPIAHATAFTASVEYVVFKRFDGCGHYLHQERPEAFVTAVREFLDDPSAVSVRLRTTDPQCSSPQFIPANAGGLQPAE
jgi:pimeloyl-ACP methyl ester carboxylesterase